VLGNQLSPERPGFSSAKSTSARIATSKTPPGAGRPRGRWPPAADLQSSVKPYRRARWSHFQWNECD